MDIIFGVVWVRMLLYLHFWHSRSTVCVTLFILAKKFKQDAQLSQRDRAAGCVIVFAKSRTLELGDNHLRTL